jgi:transcription antitermination factor NusG
MLADSSASAWYICRITAARWQWAQGAIAELGYPTYCPIEVNWVRDPRTDKRGRKSRPLIDGYLFVQVPDRRFDRIKAVPEVASFLGVPEPREVPAALVARLMVAEAAREFDRAKQPQRYAPGLGDRVKITGGPYSGFTAKVLSAKSGAGRVRVMLDLFGKASVEVDKLAKVEPERKEAA